MKRLLVPLLGDAQDDVVLSAAAAVGANKGAHIDVRLFLRNPADVITYVGEGIGVSAIEIMMESAKQNAEEILAATKVRFSKWADTENISIGDGVNDMTTSADFAEIVGPIPQSLMEPARAVDVCVVTRQSNDINVDREVLIDGALFESGRPVLIVPSEVPKIIGNRVVLAWNGSQEAACAVSSAMPTLRDAESVFVLSVTEKDSAANPTDVARTLMLNGIEASGITAPSRSDGVFATLIAESRKVSADLLVIGAYSHSRMREFVLGGVTRDLIEKSDIPVLMVH